MPFTEYGRGFETLVKVYLKFETIRSELEQEVQIKFSNKYSCWFMKDMIAIDHEIRVISMPYEIAEVKSCLDFAIPAKDVVDMQRRKNR